MKEYPCIALAMIHQGKLALSPSQKKRIAAYMQKHEGQYTRLTFAQPTKGRSNPQNRYYWGVVVEMIASETGHTTEEIHEYLKGLLLPRRFLTVGKTEVQLTKSTTTLSTQDMEEYLERARAFAATELGLSIPLPHQLDGVL